MHPGQQGCEFQSPVGRGYFCIATALPISSSSLKTSLDRKITSPARMGLYKHVCPSTQNNWFGRAMLQYLASKRREPARGANKTTIEEIPRLRPLLHLRSSVTVGQWLSELQHGLKRKPPHDDAKRFWPCIIQLMKLLLTLRKTRTTLRPVVIGIVPSIVRPQHASSLARHPASAWQLWHCKVCFSKPAAAAAPVMEDRC